MTFLFYTGTSALIIIPTSREHRNIVELCRFYPNQSGPLPPPPQPCSVWQNPNFFQGSEMESSLFSLFSDTSSVRGKPSVETTASWPWNSSSRLCKSLIGSLLSTKTRSYYIFLKPPIRPPAQKRCLSLRLWGSSVVPLFPDFSPGKSNI